MDRAASGCLRAFCPLHPIRAITVEQWPLESFYHENPGSNPVIIRSGRQRGVPVMESSSLQEQVAAALAPHAAHFVQVDEPAELAPSILIGQRPRRSIASLTLTLGAGARL